MASSPRSPTPPPIDAVDDVSMTSLLLACGGRRPLRTRPRRLLALLFAAAVALLFLFSKYPLLSEQIQTYRAFVTSRPSTSQKIVSPLGSHVVPLVVVEHAVEPVVFALLMHSEVSAKEGAVLLKVESLTSNDLEPA
jgi:hypothetical protein